MGCRKTGVERCTETLRVGVRGEIGEDRVIPLPNDPRVHIVGKALRDWPF